MYWLIDRSVNRFVKQTIFRFNRNEIIGLFHCDPSNQSLQRFNPREISCSNHLDYPFLALAEKRGTLRGGEKELDEISDVWRRGEKAEKRKRTAWSNPGHHSPVMDSKAKEIGEVDERRKEGRFEVEERK